MLATVGAVLVIHGGAFVGGSAGDLPVAKTVRALRADGVAAIAPRYPLGNPLAAEMTVDAIARRYHVTAAIGYSAGGTLAEWLAEHGDVRAAAAVAPVSDLRTWPIGPWTSTARVGCFTVTSCHPQCCSTAARTWSRGHSRPVLTVIRYGPGHTVLHPERD